MTDQKSKSTQFDELQSWAEAKLGLPAEHVPDMSPEEAARLVHDLRTHQIELEMQNEELRRSQEKLVASRDRYFDLYDFAPVGYVTISEKGLILEANLTFADWLGKERRSTINKPLSTFIVTDDQDAFCRWRRNLLQTRQGSECELRLYGKGSDPSWAKLDGTVVEANEGKTVQLRIAITDISNRKRAEDVLRESEARFRMLANVSPAGLYITDAEGHCRYVNPRWCEMAGLSPEEALGDRWMKSLHPADREQLSLQWNETIRNDKQWNAEYRFQRPDGTVTWVLGTACALYDERGSVEGYIGVNTDITDRKLADEKLRENENRFKSLYSTMSEGVCLHQLIYDESGAATDYRILDVNPAYESTLGIAHADAVGAKGSELYGFTEAPYLEQYARVAESGEPFSFDAYFSPLRKHFTISVFSPARGQFATVFNDITDLKRVEEALRESEIRSRVLLEGSPVCNKIIDLDSRLRYMSAAGIKQLKIADIEPFYGQIYPPEFYAESMRSPLVEGLERAKAGETSSVEGPVLDTEGSEVWYHTTFVPARDDEGQIQYIIASSVDITERKRVEDASRESTLRQELATKAGNVGIWDWNLDTDKCYFSPEWKKQIGYSDDEIGDDSEEWKGRVHPDDIQHKLEKVETCISHPGTTYQVEFRLRHKDGSYRWIMAHGRVLANEQDRPTRMLGSHVDITDVKNAQALLAASEATLNESQEIAQLVSFVVDFRDDSLQVSRNMHLLTGLEKKEVPDTLDGMITQIIHPEERQHVRSEIDRMIAAKRTWSMEFRINRPDGAERLWQSRSRLIFDEQGLPVKSVGVCLDVTEQRHSELERQTALELLRLLNGESDLHGMIRSTTELIRKASDCEAVGIRLRNGEDFPYFETCGFPPDFVLEENQLCAMDERGELHRDSQGMPVLECMCGNIIRGRFDPSLPFFTQNGTFWTNSTSELLASASEEDRQARTRNRCHGEGYESVMLVPLRAGDETFGLLQLNDFRKGLFSTETVDLFERLANTLAIGLALRRSEEELRNSEEKFRAIFEQAPDSIMLVDAETGNIISFNNKAYETLGYTRDEFRGLNIVDIEVVEDAGQVATHMEKLLRIGHDSFETKHRAKDGRLSDILVNMRAIHLNEHTCFLSIFTDITDRKKAEESLKKNEFYLSKAQEIGSIGTWELDIVNNVLVWTDENYKVFGVPLGTPLNYDVFLNCVHPDDREYVNQEWAKGINHQPYDIEHRLLVNGKVIWVREKAEVTYDESGNPVKAIGFTQDITKRKLAEQALDEQRARLQLSLDAALAGTWIWDIQRGVVSWDDRMQEIFGLEPGTYPGTFEAWRKLVHPDDLPGAEVATLHAAQTRQRYEHEYRVRGKAGTWRIVNSRADVITDGSGKPLRMAGMCVDVTDEREREDSFRRNERLRMEAEKLANTGRVAARVAHEINNPLAAIKNCFRLVREAIPEDHPDLKFAKMIDKEIDRVAGIVARMYELHRPQREDISDVDLGEVMSEVVLLLSGTTEEHGVSLRVRAKPSNCKARTHESSVRQVLYNLIINAVQASTEGDQVMVSMETVSESIHISIADRGVGIPVENQTKIFDPFFTTKDSGNSADLGLGLSISKSIVEALGGSMDFETKQGKGTVFRVVLPKNE